MAKQKSAVHLPDPVQLSIPALCWRSLTVMMTNLIPFYSVWQYGWSSFTLILLFIAEAVIVFLMDLIKRPYMKQKEHQKVLFFEFVFIFFFGFFAILIFGREDSSTDLLMTIRSSFQAVKSLPLWTVAGILVLRLIRTLQELLEAGAFSGSRRGPLYYVGGAWMLLLFFLCMTAPFIADRSANPTGGLVAIIVLKTLGELFGVWAQRIDRAIK